METFSAQFTGPGEFPTQRPVTRSFDVFFDLRLNKRLSKQPWGWWFEPPSWSLWRHRNDCNWWVQTFLSYSDWGQSSTGLGNCNEFWNLIRWSCMNGMILKTMHTVHVMCVSFCCASYMFFVFLLSFGTYRFSSRLFYILRNVFCLSIEKLMKNSWCNENADILLNLLEICTLGYYSVFLHWTHRV